MENFNFCHVAENGAKLHDHILDRSKNTSSAFSAVFLSSLHTNMIRLKLLKINYIEELSMWKELS